MRYTANRLCSDIYKINEWLAAEDSTSRLTCGGRNGYQAVDEYSVDVNGVRIGSGVNRNICCGTPRECNDAALTHYYQEMNRIKDARIVELTNSPQCAG